MEQNLNYYRIFYEAAKTGNLSKAAEQLYISQPAVSKSITKLEESLKLPLFIRSKKGVKLTEEGEMLYHHLHSAFQSISLAEEKLKNIEDYGISQIRIGASTSLCKHILLPYLQDFIRDNPHIKVSIACSPTFDTLQLLKEEKIDIGLICDTPLERGYHFLPIRSIQDIFVANQTYIDNLNVREQGLSGTQDSIHSTEPEMLEDDLGNIPNLTGLFFYNEMTKPSQDKSLLSTKEILEKGNLMLLDKENISRQYIDQYFLQEQITPSHMLEINNMDMLVDFATIGMGIACVVREFTTNYLESGQVTELQLDTPVPKRTVGLVYNEHTLLNSTKKLIQYFQ